MYEWDDDKNKANKARHRVAFEEAEQFDWEGALVAPDDRQDYGESRFVVVGYIGNRLHVLAFTERADKVRVISLRKANKREEKRYEKAQAGQRG